MTNYDFLSETNNQYDLFISNELSQLDDKLAQQFQDKMKEIFIYTAIAENPAEFNDESKRLKLFGQLSYGLRKAGEGYTWAKVLNKEYTRMLSTAEADVKMNSYPVWVTEQKKLDPKFKSTEDYKKTYVSTSDTVQKIVKMMILTEAMCDEFATVKTELYQAISTIRSICYGSRDSSILSGAAVNI